MTVPAWTFAPARAGHGQDAAPDLVHASGARLHSVAPAVATVHRTAPAPLAPTVAGFVFSPVAHRAESLCATSAAFPLPGGLRLVINLAVSDDPAWTSVRPCLHNPTDGPLAPADALAVFACASAAPPAGAPPFDRALLSGWDMLGATGLVNLDADGAAAARESHVVFGLTSSDGTTALVVGSAAPAQAFCPIRLAGTGFSAMPEIPHAPAAASPGTLPPGATRELPAFLLGAGPSLSALMTAYADLTAPSVRPNPGLATPTGWCSWYDHYGAETLDIVMADGAALAASDLAPHLRYLQIDDGWNLPEEGAPRNWGDWHSAGAKFPIGMKATADRIRDLGFVPGLWLAPFSADPASDLLRDHPEWMTVDPDTDGPMDFWGCRGLDLTRADVIDHVGRVFDRVFVEWGYDYVKVDFLLHAALRGRRADPTRTAAQALRAGLAAIRAAADRAAASDGRPRVILACGCPIGPAIGIADALRVGPDISRRWYLPINVGDWPEGNCSIRPGAVFSLWRQWMHGAWWTNDPDCLVAGRQGSPDERRAIGLGLEGGRYADDPPYGLTDDEAGLWARVVWLTGGYAFLSESPARTDRDRVELLLRALPRHGLRARLFDHYGDGRVPMLTIDDPADPSRPVIGVFNLTDAAVDPHIAASKLPPPDADGGWRLTELFDETLSFRLAAGEPLRALPPHSARIFRVG